MEVLVDHQLRRDRTEPDDIPELVRCVGDELTVEAQDVGGVLGRPEHRSGHDGGADRVQREPERADDAEVPASASPGPEQVGVIAGRRPHDLALGGDHLGLDEVVDGEPVLAHEPAEAAAQAEAADAGVAHDAARGRQTVRLCLVVDISPQGTALHESRALDGINRDGAHRRQVDHDPAVAHRGAAAAGNQPRSSVDGCRSIRLGRRRSRGGRGRSHRPGTQEPASWLVLTSFLLWWMGASQHRGAPRRSQRSGLRSKESGLHDGRVARDTRS